MTVIALLFGAITIAAIVTNALLNFLQRKHRIPLIVATFLVVALGAYAASFVVDMLLLAYRGDLPTANVAWPCSTWSLISASFLLAAAGRSIPRVIRILPFLFIGGLTMLAAMVQTRHIITALVLIVGGLGYGWAAGASAQSPPSNSAVRSTAKAPRAFEIGAYRTDMPIPWERSLVELTAAEYSFFPMAFESEKSYKASPTDFLGRQWNVMLGTVNGRVYKIAAFLDDLTPTEGDRLVALTMKHCITLLGKPAEQTPGLTVWDMEKGNVILRSASIMGSVSINLFATSSAMGPGGRLRK